MTANAVQVPSRTHDGVFYEVRRVGADYACTCPAFAFGPRRGRACHHITVYKAARELLRRCREAHGGDGRHLCGACLVLALGVVSRKAKRTMRARVGAPRRGRRCR